MASALESYSASEIDPIEFSALSSGEQTAVTRASRPPGSTYSDWGTSDSGSRFEYRNDVVNEYFVSYDDSVQLIRVVVAMDPLLMAAGVVGGVVGIALIIGGVWRERRAN